MSPAASAGSSPILLSSLPASAVAGPLPPTGLRPGYDTGNPQTSAIPIHAGQDGVKAGIWECQPGGWHIKNRQDTECVYLLEGRVRITTDGVGEQEFGKGDCFVLPKGWSGRWDVLETTRKYYCIAE